MTSRQDKSNKQNHGPLEPDADFDRVVIRDGWISVGGLSTQTIARQFGTPVYVYDGAELRETIEGLKQALVSPYIRLLYSVKANSNLALIRTCSRAGLGIDVCSEGDVSLALAAGVDAAQMSYTGVGLGEDEIVRLAQRGIHLNLDSLSEVARFAAACPNTKVGLRVSPGVEAGFHPHCRAGQMGGKFGISPERLEEAISLLQGAGCPVVVLHAHLGSSIGEIEPYQRALQVLLGLAEKAPTVTRLNLGGGLSARYHPKDHAFPLRQLRALIEEEFARFERKTGRRLSAEIEPGEIVVSTSACLLVRAKVVKDWRADVPGGSQVVIADGGMNLIPAHSLYGSYLHIYVDGKERLNGPEGVFDVFGNTNQTGDRLATQRTLPIVEEGDLLVIRNAGAYAYCRSTQFNERPRPAEVWIDRGLAKMIRTAETVEQLAYGQSP